jgi:flagellar assembly protein FliH
VLREPFAEIAALATECFKQLAARRTSWCASTTRCMRRRSALDEIARTRGFEGRLVVIAEPEIALGDCKIEWADGGVVRDRPRPTSPSATPSDATSAPASRRDA